MDLEARLAPAVAAAREHAAAVDADGAFPHEAVGALRQAGLLGLTVPRSDGGLGGGPAELVAAVSAVAGACGSAGMVYLMHLVAAGAVAAAPPPDRPGLLGRLGSGEKLATLAFSEPGSRSHFWAPISQAQTVNGDGTRLKAGKSFVTSAGVADVYLVSTLTSPELVPAEAPVPVDVYAVDGTAEGVSVVGTFRGLGLRGNASAPMNFDLTAPAGARLGAAGSGFGLMLETVMPWFNLGNAAVSLGLAQVSVDLAVAHTSGARLQHVGQTLAQLPTIRAQLARAALELETTRSYVHTTASAMAAGNGAAQRHVLGVKAVANDAALRITDVAMRVCGGAAFSAQLPLERHFRDARAGSVMGPTADVLYDYYAKVLTGQPLF